MGKTGVISALALLALALAALLEASKLPFGKLSSPQAGFFPLILAAILAAFSLLLLGQAIKERQEGASAFRIGPGTWKRISLAIGALVAFALVFESLGYITSTFLLIAFLLRAVERQKWWLVAVVAFSTSLVTYLIFGLFLETPLPPGILRL
jgi:putative tricarboxylic transport membrane protein